MIRRWWDHVPRTPYVPIYIMFALTFTAFYLDRVIGDGGPHLVRFFDLAVALLCWRRVTLWLEAMCRSS